MLALRGNFRPKILEEKARATAATDTDVAVDIAGNEKRGEIDGLVRIIIIIIGTTGRDDSHGRNKTEMLESKTKMRMIF